jgi:hypothetical protein
MDAMIADLVAAYQLTVGPDALGRETWTLTPIGAQLAAQMAMGHQDDAAALQDASLDAA